MEDNACCDTNVETCCLIRVLRDVDEVITDLSMHWQ